MSHEELSGVNSSSVEVIRDPRMKKELKKIKKNSSGKVIVGKNKDTNTVIKANIKKALDHNTNELENRIKIHGKNIIHHYDETRGKLAEPLRGHSCYYSGYIIHEKGKHIRLIFVFFKDFTQCVFLAIFQEKDDSISYDRVIKKRVNDRLKEWGKRFGKCSKRS